LNPKLMMKHSTEYAACLAGSPVLWKNLLNASRLFIWSYMISIVMAAINK